MSSLPGTIKRKTDLEHSTYSTLFKIYSSQSQRTGGHGLCFTAQYLSEGSEIVIDVTFIRYVYYIAPLLKLDAHLCSEHERHKLLKTFPTNRIPISKVIGKYAREDFDVAN